MSNPLLSVCVPTFNRSPFLRELLQSFSEQVEGMENADQAVSFHILDNDSDDDTSMVAASFSGVLPGFQYLKNESNLGIRQNVLNAQLAGQGEYIWVVGDDELLCRDALPHLIQVLKMEKPGLVIAFNTNYDLKMKPPLHFPTFRDYAAACVRANPHALAEHTLCSCNILRRDCYDPAWAEENIELFYGQMFGMVRGLHRRKAVVTIPDFPIITIREITSGSSPADGQWADVDKCWVNYLGFLKTELDLPDLDPQAPSRMARQQMFFSLRSNPLRFILNRWRSLFSWSAYKFALNRLLGKNL